jgi:hypothetical protein
MVAEHLDNPKTFAATFGVRSLSKMEKMYNVQFTRNPSNWQGRFGSLPITWCLKDFPSTGFKIKRLIWRIRLSKYWEKIMSKPEPSMNTTIQTRVRL